MGEPLVVIRKESLLTRPVCLENGTSSNVFRAQEASSPGFEVAKLIELSKRIPLCFLRWWVTSALQMSA